MSVLVRRAKPEEYARVGLLTVDAYRQLPVDHLWGGYEDAILDTAGRAETTEILVAVVDGTVVGAVTYVDDPSSPWNEGTEPGEAQFRLLAVDPAARGQGAGESLVRECVARAARAAKPLLIHTTPWMTAALRMYERLGFVRVPSRDLVYEAWLEEVRAQVGDFDLPAEWVGQSFLAFGLGLARGGVSDPAG